MDTTSDRTPLSRYDLAPLAKRSPLRLVRHLPARLVVDPSMDIQSKGHPGLDDDLLIRFSGVVEHLIGLRTNPHARRASRRDRNTPREPGGRRSRPPNQVHARSDARRHPGRASGQCFPVVEGTRGLWSIAYHEKIGCDARFMIKNQNQAARYLAGVSSVGASASSSAFAAAASAAWRFPSNLAASTS